MSAIYRRRLGINGGAAAFAGVLLRVATASAEPPPAPADPQSANATTAYSFEDESVLGSTRDPVGEVLHVRPRPARASLVRAREHFVPELLQSIEAL
jgi:hypothetical protein